MCFCAADRGFVPDRKLLRAGDAASKTAAAAAAAMANLPGMGPLAGVPGKGQGALDFAWQQQQQQQPFAAGVSAHLQPQGDMDAAGKSGGFGGDRRPDLSFLDRATAGGAGVGSSAASTLSAGTAETLRDSRATTATEGGESDDGEGGRSGRLSVARVPGTGGERAKPLLQTDGLGPTHAGDRGYLPTGIPGGGGGTGAGATGGKPAGVTNLLAPFGGGGVNVGSGIGAAMSPFPVVGAAQPADATAGGSGGSAGSGTFPFNVALPTPLEASSMSSGPAGARGGAAGGLSSAAHPFLFPSMTDLFASHVKGFDAFRLGGGGAPGEPPLQQLQQPLPAGAPAASGGGVAASEQRDGGMEAGVVVRPSPTPAGFGATGGALGSLNHAGRADVGGGGGRDESQRQVSGAVRKRGSEDAPAQAPAPAGRAAPAPGSGAEQPQGLQLRITSPALGPAHQRRRTDDGSGGSSVFVPFSRNGSFGSGSSSSTTGPQTQGAGAAGSGRSLPRSSDDGSAVEESGADGSASAAEREPKAAPVSSVPAAAGSSSTHVVSAPAGGSDAATATASTISGAAPASHLLSQSAHPFASTFSPTTDLLGTMRGQAPPWASHVSRPASATEGGLLPRGATSIPAAAGAQTQSLSGVGEGAGAPFTPGIPLPGAFAHTFTPTPHDANP
jgi:hypothetical protein